MATAQENRNPHKAARVAMIMWGGAYAAQSGGSMDFWEKLGPNDKKLCRELVKEIENAPVEASQ